MATPMKEKKVIETQRSVIDLDTFEKVTLVKQGEFAPVEGDHFVKDALERLGNDHGRLRDVINKGLEDAAREELAANAEPWCTETDDGDFEVYEGIPADAKKVNELRMVLARTMFGYRPGKEFKESNKKAKADAMEVIKTTDILRNGLKS